MKYGLDRGKLLRFVVFILVWVVKKKVRLFQTWLFAVPWFILNSDCPSLSVRKEKNRFLHFSQPCILLSLQCKFDKHTTSSCLAGVFLLCIYFIGDSDWDGVVLWSSNIVADSKSTDKKKTGAKKISLDPSSVLKQVSSGFEYHIIHINKCTISEKCSLWTELAISDSTCIFFFLQFTKEWQQSFRYYSQNSIAYIKLIFCLCFSFYLFLSKCTLNYG